MPERPIRVDDLDGWIEYAGELESQVDHLCGELEAAQANLHELWDKSQQQEEGDVMLTIEGDAVAVIAKTFREGSIFCDADYTTLAEEALEATSYPAKVERLRLERNVLREMLIARGVARSTITRNLEAEGS